MSQLGEVTKVTIGGKSPRSQLGEVTKVTIGEATKVTMTGNVLYLINHARYEFILNAYRDPYKTQRTGHKTPPNYVITGVARRRRG